jgi:ATP-binding cassette subfamily B protein
MVIARWGSGLVEIVRMGVRATPAWFFGSVLISLLGPASLLSLPVAARFYIDGLGDRDADKLVSATVIFTIGAALTWVVTVLDASIASGLVTRVEPTAIARIGSAVSQPTGIAHLEAPDLVASVHMLRDDRYQLIQAPRALVLALRLVARSVGILMLLVVVDPWLALVTVPAVAPFLADRAAQQRRTAVQADRAPSILRANETFRLATAGETAAEVRVAGLYPDLRDAHQAASKRLVDAETRTALRELGLTTLGWLAFLGGLMIGITAIVGGVASGRHALGDVVMVVLLMQTTGTLVTEGVPTLSALGDAVRVVGRLREFEDRVGDLPAGDRVPPARLATGISLDNVSFRYPNAASDTLRDISVDLPAGATVAIVGANGAGKSSLVKILAGLYRPSSGEVRVDGQALESLRLTEWRGVVTAAFQDYVKYAFTLRQNVGLGDLRGIDDDALVAAALAKVEGVTLIEDLADGLDTKLATDGAWGASLSGGQWQRVAVARALMPSSALLVLLDEPTAALDARTEHQLFATYARAGHDFGERTGAITVLVTHRFSSVRDADIILVLAEGELVEVGSHEDLLAAGGTYAELFQLQVKGYQ